MVIRNTKWLVFFSSILFSQIVVHIEPIVSTDGRRKKRREKLRTMKTKTDFNRMHCKSQSILFFSLLPLSPCLGLPVQCRAWNYPKKEKIEEEEKTYCRWLFRRFNRKIDGIFECTRSIYANSRYAMRTRSQPAASTPDFCRDTCISVLHIYSFDFDCCAFCCRRRSSSCPIEMQ